MNVSKDADAEFMRRLAEVDPVRHQRLLANMRTDSPNAGMDERQALTNFMLGLPTGNFRFAVIAGEPAPAVREPDSSNESAERRRRTRKLIGRARAGRIAAEKPKNVAAAH